jgi:hypothetical protein
MGTLPIVTVGLRLSYDYLELVSAKQVSGLYNGYNPDTINRQSTLSLLKVAGPFGSEPMNLTQG